ncbi:hypothetical protein [Snodgrassella alvi]|uniref:hypothetical protein n=1 Tax=Snodgrassella alvi TaxID=1196083 RepID=UPI00351A1DB7
MTKKIKPMKEPLDKGIDYFTVDYFSKDYLPENKYKDISIFKFSSYTEYFDYKVLERGIAFQKLKHAKRAANFIFNLMSESEPLPGCITYQPDEGTRVWIITLLTNRYCSIIDFSQSNEQHQKFLKNHVLFSSEKDARAAAKFILAALKAEVLRQNLNCLTEAPVDGTMVYALSIYGVGGVITLQFKSNNSCHMQLLELGLLYKSREDAKRALEYLKEPLKPTRPKAVPDEPDAQPVLPAERDNGSDE